MDEELKPSEPAPAADLAGAAEAVARRAAGAQADGRMPAIYLGHGAPPLVDDPLWVAQLAAWAGALPRPTAILMVSAHWEAAPTTLGATRDGVPLIYDFYGFPERYYRTVYPAPAAPDLAARVRDLLAAGSRSRSSPSAVSITAPTYRCWSCTPGPTCPCCRSHCPPSSPTACSTSAPDCGRCATKACS